MKSRYSYECRPWRTKRSEMFKRYNHINGLIRLDHDDNGVKEDYSSS